ncbi:PREDICTED: heavy metal-associated isoprenylated plant protein 3 isoform X1 [Theobroma cacao]|uniref:Heavy metal-associated isoprenylated plant protein 3 isoform X1 n=1 Tax=Theobroma cacao TaxID=3641 RepID=A0AB32V6K1_THECC|nr:PREDICTED: heavy metal-associated isoprenylated plant protein 3 isoform X1 [Theobroma cacao]
MATSEGKADTKQEAKATESKEAEENQEPPLKYKAWVLKVSIHCEACKRKVEKTLRKIDGVYEAIADLRQQKATVKANLHVDVETLIKKLIKKGRHAELWPEKAGQKEKKQGKSKNKDKQSGQANGDQEGNSNRGVDKEKEAEKAESTVQQDTAKSCENGSTAKNAEGCNNVRKAHEGGSAPCKTGGQVKESKPDQVKQTVILAAGNQSPVAERKGGGGGDSEGNAGEKSGGGGGGGGGSKKNKKKGQKGNANANLDEGEHSGDAGPAFIGSHFPVYGPHGPVPMPSPASYSPPRHHQMYEYPTYSHAPPVYVTSYNTAYPSSSYSAAYYASSPYSYAYMHPGPMSERPPSDQGLYPYYSSQPSDSFEMFSDENPNACSIM